MDFTIVLSALSVAAFTLTLTGIMATLHYRMVAAKSDRVISAMMAEQEKTRADNSKTLLDVVRAEAETRERWAEIMVDAYKRKEK